MSKKIPLYVFGHGKSYYVTHPWKWFQDLWIGAKNFIHRGRYGWAWVDLWNTDDYWGILFPICFMSLPRAVVGGLNPMNFLHLKIGLALEEVAHTFDILNSDERIYFDYDRWCEIKSQIPEKYFPTPSTSDKKWECIMKEIDDVRRKCFEFLITHWGTLWD